MAWSDYSELPCAAKSVVGFQRTAGHAESKRFHGWGPGGWTAQAVAITLLCAIIDVLQCMRCLPVNVSIWCTMLTSLEKTLKQPSISCYKNDVNMAWHLSNVRSLVKKDMEFKITRAFLLVTRGQSRAPEEKLSSQSRFMQAHKRHAALYCQVNGINSDFNLQVQGQCGPGKAVICD